MYCVSLRSGSWFPMSDVVEFLSCSHVHGLSVGKYMYILSGFRCSSLLISSVNLGQDWSHDVWLNVLQFTHQCLSWSFSVHLAVLWSLLQVPQTMGFLHVAARWGASKD